MADMIDLLVLFTELEGEYAIQVRSPEVGETPQPAPRVRSEDLQKIGEDLAKARDAGREGEISGLGEDLFSQLFRLHNRDLYQSARALSKKSSCAMRLLLAMAPHSPLQLIPWELLHDGTGFLARDLGCVVVRYMEGKNPVRSVELQPPVRILVTSACPVELRRLDLEPEIKGIHDAYKEHRKDTIFRYYDHTSLQNLREILHGAVLAGEPFHVWHHCGHGDITTSTMEFQLYLELHRHIEAVGVSEIMRVLGKCKDLRVVVLNVCSAASAKGLAPEVAKLNIPSVLSFSSKIGDIQARTFALALHHGLLTLPIEIAADIARASICKPGPATWHWSNLILFSRRSDSGPLLAHSRPISRKKQLLNEIYKNIIEKSRQASN
jgi:hypothetical protein